MKKFTLNRGIVIMHKNLKNIISGILVITTVFISAGCSLAKDAKTKMKAELIHPQEKNFEKYEVNLSRIRYSHSGDGTVESRNTVNLHSSISGGVLEKVYCNIWQNIKKGDIIAKFYTKNIDNKIELQEITVQEYESDLKTLKDSNNKEKIELALKREKTRLRQLVEEKEAHVFRSPIDGVISAITDAKTGSVIGMNEVLATIKDGGSLVVIGAPDNENINKYYVGMEGEIIYDNTSYPARVKQINPETKGETRTVKGVTLEFKDSIPKDIKLGDKVNYTVFGEEKKDVIVVPTKFIRTDESRKNYVYVMKDGVREKRILELGVHDKMNVEIISGVKANEIIILN